MSGRRPPSSRNVEDLPAERGIGIGRETVRPRWNRFGPLFAAEIRKHRVKARHGSLEWRYSAYSLRDQAWLTWQGAHPTETPESA